MTLNLLSNAVKFSEHGGLVEVNVSAQNGVVSLSVRDSGAGMSPAEVERLGEPFFQAGDAERRARGSGLGLAVVRALVKLHDGAFEVTSSVGGGTTVTISLPVRRSSGVVSPSRGPSPMRPAARTMRGAGSHEARILAPGRDRGDDLAGAGAFEAFKGGTQPEAAAPARCHGGRAAGGCTVGVLVNIFSLQNGNRSNFMFGLALPEAIGKRLTSRSAHPADRHQGERYRCRPLRPGADAGAAPAAASRRHGAAGRRRAARGTRPQSIAALITARACRAGAPPAPAGGGGRAARAFAARLL